MPSLYSMTAFGRATASNDFVSVEWELKTLNNRYLELGFKLPDSARAVEADLHRLAKKALTRGKLDGFVRIQATNTQHLAIDTERLQQLTTQLHQVNSLYPGAGRPSSLELLQWPGVISDNRHSEQLATLLKSSFQAALDDLKQARAREGEQLATLLLQRLHDIQQHTATLATAVPALQQKQHRRLTDKLAELGLDTGSERVEQELVMLANKSDVAEELDRLQAHCNEIRRIVTTGGSCGRRLDFMMQELNREANTLGSKAAGTEVTQAVVAIKVLIEQMREQVQNVE